MQYREDTAGFGWHPVAKVSQLTASQYLDPNLPQLYCWSLVTSQPGGQSASTAEFISTIFHLGPLNTLTLDLYFTLLILGEISTDQQCWDI